MRPVLHVLCASITFAVGPLEAQPFTINSLSSTTAIALSPLYISTTGIDLSGDPVVVQFSDGRGFSMTEQALRIASDGTVTIGVPLYIDPVSQVTTSGSVSVTVTQGNQSTTSVSLDIQDLPPLSSYGTKLGDISHAFLVYSAMLTSRRIDELQAYQALPGNTIDTLQAQESLQVLLQGVIKARSDVDEVSVNSSLAITGPQLSNGQTLVFDNNALDLIDRAIALYLYPA
jgi:hypothetical protein